MRNAAFALSVIAATAVAAPAAHAEQLWLKMDQVRPYSLETEAGQIVIGNPGIADVEVHDRSRIFLFGKAPGATNIFIFDENGNTVKDLQIRVQASGDGVLTFHRGTGRSTYQCLTICEPTTTVGDDSTVFQNTAQQMQTKLQQITAGAGDN